MSQEKPNPQSPQSPLDSKLEASHSPDEEPFLGKNINSSQTPSVLEKFQLMWNGALVKIRSFLPENLASKLSDRALTGIIIAIALVFFGVSVSTFTQKPKEIVTVSPQAEAPKSNPVPQTQPKEKITESPVSTEQSKSASKDTKISTKHENPPVKETSKPSLTLAQEENLPQSDKKRIIETKQQQVSVLTPEQTLVAIIENQIAQVTNRLNEDTKDETFSSKLIRSVQADFASSTLTLKISDDWYSLQKSRQDKLAAEILERSKELDFTHLEITDSENKLIARNPVVGNEMIIFKR